MTSISPHTTRANGTILTATVYNTDHTNHISNAQALNSGKVEGATPPVVDGHVPVFDGTSGTGIRTAGHRSVVPAAESVIGNIVTFADEDGRELADSGFPAAEIGFGSRTEVASAATVDLAGVTNHHARITGTTGISSFGDSGSSDRPIYLVSFADALTITHGASLICPDGIDLVTAANDYAWVEDVGSDVWRIFHYVKISETISPGGRATDRQIDGRTNLGAVLDSAVFPGAICCIAEDNQSQGNSGAALVDDSTTVRTINTLVYNRDSAFSLASNRLTVPAGTWELEWFAPVGGNDPDNGVHQSQLFNHSTSTIVKQGTSCEHNETSGASWTGMSVGSTVVTVAEATQFTVRHRVAHGGGSMNQGDACNFSTEVYTRLIVRAA